MNGASTIRVGIIGGGSAGLASARAFLKTFPSPLSVHIDLFEKEATTGGVWDYKHRSVPPTPGKKKDVPMYKSLRTNLPRELMAFKEVRLEEE